MKRKEFKVTQKKETKSILKLSERLLSNNIHAGNTVLISVSGDYSCLAGQMLRHSLSCDGEICEGFSIDVPYPDETWDVTYLLELKILFELYNYKIKNKNILLVEAGVIRGSNYTFIIDYLKNTLGITKEIHTLALYENSRSVFKSDFVAHYYDDEKEDLTFWWERYNSHWNKR